MKKGEHTQRVLQYTVNIVETRRERKTKRESVCVQRNTNISCATSKGNLGCFHNSYLVQCTIAQVL